MAYCAYSCAYALVIGFPEGDPRADHGDFQGGDAILMNFPRGGGT